MVSPEASRKPVVPEIIGSPAEKADELPALERILRGEATIRPQGEDLMTRPDDGVLCRVYTFEITIPEAKPDGSDWVTSLSYWAPSPADSNDEWWQDKPSDTLTILTGHGDIRFLRDPEVITAILDEISRQISETTAS